MKVRIVVRVVAVISFAAMLSFIMWLVFLRPAVSAESGMLSLIPGPVRADVLSVYDGDTFTVRAYVWPRHTIRVAVRVRGVDTPELRGKCVEEKTEAVKARDYVRQVLLDKMVNLYDIKLGKYAGRVIATVEFQDESGVPFFLSRELIRLKLGRSYSGGRRESWCDG